MEKRDRNITHSWAIQTAQHPWPWAIISACESDRELPAQSSGIPVYLMQTYFGKMNKITVLCRKKAEYFSKKSIHTWEEGSRQWTGDETCPRTAATQRARSATPPLVPPSNYAPPTWSTTTTTPLRWPGDHPGGRCWGDPCSSPSRPVRHSKTIPYKSKTDQK